MQRMIVLQDITNQLIRSLCNKYSAVMMENYNILHDVSIVDTMTIVVNKLVQMYLRIT